jgi:hypothetical protein
MKREKQATPERPANALYRLKLATMKSTYYSYSSESEFVRRTTQSVAVRTECEQSDEMVHYYRQPVLMAHVT